MARFAYPDELDYPSEKKVFYDANIPGDREQAFRMLMELLPYRRLIRGSLTLEQIRQEEASRFKLDSR